MRRCRGSSLVTAATRRILCAGFQEGSAAQPPQRVPELHLRELEAALAEHGDHPLHGEVAALASTLVAEARGFADAEAMPERVVHGDLKPDNLLLDRGGHLKLADHDDLDTSNGNRLRAPIHEIGRNKAVLAARQISEFAPYLRVTPVVDGVTDDNLDAFFQDLDVVIDECDDFRIKYRIREEARRRKIPVLMETSDRGLVDVERFDLEPQRPPFHGLLPGVCSEDLREMGDGEKLKMLLQLMDPHRISTRGCASLLETKETLERPETDLRD